MPRSSAFDMAYNSLVLEHFEELATDAERMIRGHRFRIGEPLAPDVIAGLKPDFDESFGARSGEYIKLIRNNPHWFKGYGRKRLEWLEDFREALAEFDDSDEEGPSFRIPRQVVDYPWWQWYAAIRGEPPQDFPGHLSWIVCLHRLYYLRGA